MKEREHIHNEAFKSMIKFISWTGLIVCVLLAALRYYVLNEPLMNIAPAAAFIPLVLASLVAIYKYDNYDVGRWSLLGYILLVQPVHVWKTGGLFSFGIVWFAVVIPYTAIFFKRNVFWFVITWLSCVLLYLALNPTPIDPAQLQTPQLLARAITLIGAFFVLMAMIRISMINRDRLRDEFVSLEKKQVVADMAINMAHEINNPLAIISLKAALLKRKGVDPEQLEPLSESVDRIHDTVEKLKSLSLNDRVEIEPISDSLPH